MARKKKPTAETSSRESTRESTGESADRGSPGQFAYEGLDRVLHEKARLGIMTSLYTHPGGLSFNDLKALCSLTDGNLSRHLSILGEAGVIEIQKGFHRRRPQTLCKLSGLGRKRFMSYVGELERVLSTVAAHSSSTASRKSHRGTEDPGLFGNSLAPA